jgi:CheY-like chemotaxis protein
MGSAARALRVLVVDDYPDILESTATLLRLDGHDVETASDGLEGIERAASFRPLRFGDQRLHRMQAMPLRQTSSHNVRHSWRPAEPLSLRLWVSTHLHSWLA